MSDLRIRIDQIEKQFGGSLDYLLKISSKYDEYVSRCKQKNIEFHMDFASFDFMVKDSCYYCGYNSKKSPNGIDRVDPKKGYVANNCLPCCWTCNKAKGNMSIEDFQEYLSRFKK